MMEKSFGELNKKIQEEILRKMVIVEERRQHAGYIPLSGYFINKLKEKIISANGDLPNISDVEVEFIDREKFGGDVAVKIPTLLKTMGGAPYIKEIVPKLLANLEKLAGEGKEFIEVQSRGIYLNILLDNGYLFENIWQAVKMGEKFGQSDFFKGKALVIDYSSPNVAKHLHAGHIRSTIIGEVLANIYEAVGHTVHRLNYINDWGGMGYLMEGYDRWSKKIPREDSKNAELYFIYKIFREGERVAAEEREFNIISPAESDRLADYYGDFGSFEEFKDLFADFKSAADRRFQNLEGGALSEFQLWKKIREWSMEEFDNFYNLIGVRHDYILGESFYAKRAENLLDEKISRGEVVLFTKEMAEREEDIEAIDDVGAYVVPLSNHKRLLVRKSNGSTLYATRDLAGIKHRIETWNPWRLVYEVGEEQAEYFRNLFEASRILHLDQSFDKDHPVELSHIWHGFYVDATTGHKLASREGADSVEGLIKKSIEYFKNKYEENAEGDAKKLAVGSIVFNDIKQDRRFPVALNRDFSQAVKNFEESGGAYVMYALARARSILRKSGATPKELLVGVDDFKDLTDEEINIIKTIGNFPGLILRAATDDNPATLALCLLNLANQYNAYYEKARVLEGGKLLYPHRLLITAAVAEVLLNGLKICHAEAPEII